MKNSNDLRAMLDSLILTESAEHSQQCKAAIVSRRSMRMKDASLRSMNAENSDNDMNISKKTHKLMLCHALMREIRKSSLEKESENSLRSSVKDSRLCQITTQNEFQTLRDTRRSEIDGLST